VPIRPELRHLYRAAHRAERARLIAEHGAICQKCGAARETYLNLCHLTHDPLSAKRALWCPSCHARNDSPHRLAMMRRTRARRAGQLWLMPEIEFDPVPAWQIPRDRVLEAAQQRLPFA
jgi:predicted amidophosphoribosyltransferase